MALPLIPLVIGTAVGSLATYLYKDDKAREKLKITSNKIADKVKSFMQTEQNTETTKEEEIEEANPIS